MERELNLLASAASTISFTLDPHLMVLNFHYDRQFFNHCLSLLIDQCQVLFGKINCAVNFFQAK